MKILKYVLLIIVLSLPSFNRAQQVEPDRFAQMKAQLDVMIAESPGLEDPVKLSVSNLPLKDFLRALANSNNVNLSIDPAVEGTVVNNFSNVSVSEVLIYLAQQYNLDMEFLGNIITIKPYTKPKPVVIKIPRTIPLSYDTATTRLSIELKNDTLSKVARAFTEQTGRNVVYKPSIQNKRISIYLENVPFDQAMDKIAYANDLQISKTEDGFYLIQDPPSKEESEFRLRDLSSKPSARGKFYVDSNLISLDVENQPLGLVVSNLFEDLGADYFLYSQLNGNVTTKVTAVNLNDLLTKLFSGTNYTYMYRDSIYLIGERAFEMLRESRQIYLRHRSVDKVMEFIPSDLRKGVEIKEFGELNSLIVSGAPPLVSELENFIQDIDKPVPVVVIEVMIVDYQRNNRVATGIEMGTGQNPQPGTGTLMPGFDYTFDANAINELISSFNGFGALNLGPVPQSFYFNLRFLEENGVLNVKSTPKLSTLNGHEANLSIGNTEYYVVEQTNITGVQNPIPVTTRNYNQVQANFTLKIKPFVSADGQVTLDINVEQSDFTARISPEAPPGTVTRTFTSMIRVKNNEMILLGGLEEKSNNNTGRGVPLLSRIPVIKWLFSSREATGSKSKLNIFIKPSILE